jgi:hypothetical protein
LKERDVNLAVERMQTHLEGVRVVLEKWDPEKTPIA